ncbi:hypothetical protein EGT07_01710 [Herbaspirillum sp. HC18]|nr:hypothetical protein EGT07_01710 [Herbaspirillum sp. HC18]
MKALVFIFAVLIPQIGLTQESPRDVTNEQISFYKLGVETGCRDQGRRKGDENAEKFCACVLEVLSANVSHEEWQKAYFFSHRRQDRDEMRVLGPHIEKARTCRPNKS